MSLFYYNFITMRIYIFILALLTGLVLPARGQFGTGKSEFIFPMGIALDRQGNIYISEAGNDRIQKLSPELEWLAWWGRYGSDSLSLNDPIGIAVTDKDLVLVADSGNRRLVGFDREGHFQFQLQLPDSACPWGLAVKDDLIYLSDEGRSLVEVRQGDGTLVLTIGGPGQEPGRFIKPRGIAIDKEGRIWVVDSGNDRIQIFSPQGELIKYFGSYGDSEGEFDNPSGIAISELGLVYVVDSGNDRFQEFSADGAFRSQGGATGQEMMQFYNPVGIAVDPQGNLFIVDCDNHRLQFLSSQ